MEDIADIGGWVRNGAHDPIALSDLAAVYLEQNRFADALPLVEKTIATNTSDATVALPVLFKAGVQQITSADRALDDGLNVAQHALQTSAGQALNALAARLSAGTGRLAELVRRDQDLASNTNGLDKALIAALSKEPSKRDPAAEQAGEARPVPHRLLRHSWLAGRRCCRFCQAQCRTGSRAVAARTANRIRRRPSYRE